MMYDSAFIKDHVIKPKTWSPKKDAVGEHISYIDLSSVDKEDKTLVYSLIQNIDASEAPSRAKQLVHKDDILVSTVRPNLNGVAIVSRELFNATASTGYCVLRTAESLHNKYLFYWVRSKSFINDMIRKSKGASYPAVSDKIIKDSKIPLPPLDQQKKIATILDAADVYRQKTKALIEKYDELTQSLFLDMFGDPVSNPKGWEPSKLGLIVENKDSKRKPVKSSDRENMDGDYPYYGASGIIDYVNWFTHEGDNLLIGEDGANLLARSKPIAFIAKGQYWVNNHAHVLGFNGKALLVFIEFFINLIDLSNYVTGSAQPKLNRKNMDQIKIFCPPIELQNQFAERVTVIESQKAQTQASLAGAENLFNSLLQRAFKGELTD